jgi:TonB family protein
MKFILPACFIFCFLTSYSQDKNKFYALDAKLKETVLDSSKYILWVHEIEDSNWQFDYYKTWGPLVKTQTFADREGTVLNGRSSIYNSFGNLDSTGIYDHGKKNGSFFKLKSYSKDSMVTIRQTDYVEDSLVKMKDLLTDSNKKKDSDSLKYTDPAYPGGLKDWISYIINNLKYPERASNKSIQGNVYVRFTVDTEGSLSDIFIQKSAEYSLDQEAIRVVKNSGKWEPASENGVLKKAYKTESIYFSLQAK